MAVATFDTLKFANTLKSAGVPDKQAEAQAEAFSEVIQLNLKELVTKDDLRRDLAELKADLKHDIAELRGEMKLMRWMLGAVIGLLVSIVVRLFIFRGPI